MAPQTREIRRRHRSLQRPATLAPDPAAGGRPAFAALILLIATPVAAARQDLPHTVVDANIPPSREWTHHLPFSDIPEGIRSVAFAPDRDTIYVHHTVPAIDAWALGVHYWPEILAVILAFATLLLALVIWRVKRRPQTRGTPHCRRCNYDLSPQVTLDPRGRFHTSTDARCPECGLILARRAPVRGRRSTYRLLPALSAWLLLVSGYGAMHAAALPRDGTASTWLDWSSTTLAEFAKQRGLSWASRIKEGDRVVEVDLKTGNVLRTVTTRRSETWTELAVTPDGSSLVLAGDRPGQLQLVSTRTGRRRAQITLPEANHPSELCPRAVIGFSADGASAFVQWAGASYSSGASNWNFASGELQTIASTPPSVWFGRPFILRTTSPLRLVSISSFLEAEAHRKVVIRFYDGIEREGTDELIIIPGLAPLSAASACDGRFLFLTSSSGAGLRTVDLELRRIVEVLSAGVRTGFSGRIVVSRDSRLLVAGSSSGLLVRTIAERRWIAALQLPDSLYAADPHVSRDNRWVAAILLSGTGRASPIRRELVIWNLAQILDTSPSESP